jgi:hypothetical protein
MTGLDDVCRIHKVFSDGPSGDKPSLVQMDQEGDNRVEAEGETFRMDFNTTVLEGYRSEIFRPVCTSFFRKKDVVGFIDWAKISTKGMEVIEGLEQLRVDEVPILY